MRPEFGHLVITRVHVGSCHTPRCGCLLHRHARRLALRCGALMRVGKVRGHDPRIPWFVRHGSGGGSGCGGGSGSGGGNHRRPHCRRRLPHRRRPLFREKYRVAAIRTGKVTAEGGRDLDLRLRLRILRGADEMSAHAPCVTDVDAEVRAHAGSTFRLRRATRASLLLRSRGLCRVCVNIYIYTHTHTQMRVCVCVVCVCVCVCMYMYIHTYITYRYTYTHTHTHTHTYISSYIHTLTPKR